MVAAGNRHGMALHADGTVRTWGDDSQGQLGLGRTLAAPAPAPVLGINDAVRVVSGSNHVVALRRDGTVAAWGTNLLRQLGDGSNTSRSLPAPVTAATSPVRSIFIRPLSPRLKSASIRRATPAWSSP